MKSIRNKKIKGIFYSELGVVIGFYLFFIYIYHLTLCFNRYEGSELFSSFFNLNEILEQSGLQYLLKFILSIPVWWLIFSACKNIKLRNRLWIHAISLPLWVLVCQQSYYALADYLGLIRLKGPGTIWDIYIPTLFYILQFGLLHAYEYYQTSKKQLEETAAFQKAALKSELSAIKAQLNPHFLYNAFNTISASVPKENEKTRELIAHLSDTFRYVLKSTHQELISLREELLFLKKYLLIEKARFEDRLEIIFDIPQELMDEKIPNMILQPLIENALKHGIAPKIKGGSITISIRKKPNSMWFEIADTGKGIENLDLLLGTGIGLTNTQLRLEKLYQSELQFFHNKPSGLIIQFNI